MISLTNCKYCRQLCDSVITIIGVFDLFLLHYFRVSKSTSKTCENLKAFIFVVFYNKKTVAARVSCKETSVCWITLVK